MTAGLTPIRVLIADDNRSVRKGLRLQLEAARGIHVLGEVSNGSDAVTVARRERADVVLMDVQMPGMSGVEATRELTRSTTAPPVAVIVMTSYAIDAYVTDALMPAPSATSSRATTPTSCWRRSTPRCVAKRSSLIA